MNERSKAGKDLPQQAEVAQGVPVTLRPRIFLTFASTRMVGPQPYAPAAAESIPGHMVLSAATEKFPSDTTGNRSRESLTGSAVP